MTEEKNFVLSHFSFVCVQVKYAERISQTAQENTSRTHAIGACWHIKMFSTRSIFGFHVVDRIYCVFLRVAESDAQEDTGSLTFVGLGVCIILSLPACFAFIRSTWWLGHVCLCEYWVFAVTRVRR